jgi:hypothetical protein
MTADEAFQTLIDLGVPRVTLHFAAGDNKLSLGVELAYPDGPRQDLTYAEALLPWAETQLGIWLGDFKSAYGGYGTAAISLTTGEVYIKFWDRTPVLSGLQRRVTLPRSHAATLKHQLGR